MGTSNNSFFALSLTLRACILAIFRGFLIYCAAYRRPLTVKKLRCQLVICKLRSTAQCLVPRWELFFLSGLFLFGFEVILALAEFLLEPFDASGGIDEFLLAGVKRMAHRADFGMNFFGRTAGFKGIAATTANLYYLIFRMNIFLHCFYLQISSY